MKTCRLSEGINESCKRVTRIENSKEKKKS